MQIEFTHTTKLRVRYGETDQMGYCYYGNYAQYVEVGRVEALRSVGMSYKEMEEKGIMLPVSEFQVKYLYPAKYDDELTIESKITLIKGSRMYFEHEIKNEEDKLISTSKITLAFVSKTTMRPILPPESFLNLILKHEK
jgi:acyl-CoA thioester hydrolase